MTMGSDDTFVIRHGGRDFIATGEMARIFERQAQRLVSAGETELVVLRHSDGVEMVLIASSDSYSVRRVGVPIPRLPRLSPRFAV